MIYNPPPTPQPYVPPTLPTQPVDQQEGQGGTEKPKAWTLSTIIFGSLFGVLTVVALIVAAMAPDSANAGGVTVPTTWNTVYQGDLTNPTTTDNKAWNEQTGCAFYTGANAGLDANASGASDGALCDFTQAGAGGAADSGFYLEMKLAPAANLSLEEEGVLAVGDFTGKTAHEVFFLVGQDGSYILCADECASGGAYYISATSSAWHTDSYVANTIGIRVEPDHQSFTVFINRQRVLTEPLDLGAHPSVAVGAPDGAEALFTSATFSTGQ